VNVAQFGRRGDPRLKVDELTAPDPTAADPGMATRLDAARAELHPLLMKSRLAERMHERAPAEPARYRSLDHVYRNIPEGEDSAGLLLDAYLLERPFAKALRERRSLVSERLQTEVRRRGRPGHGVRVLSLGCGPARALADVLDQPGISELLSLTCVDDDQEAIVFANNLLKGHAPRVDLTLHQTRPSNFSSEGEEYRGFDVVASLFIADTLATEALAATVRRAYEWLVPGGVFLLAAFSDEEAAADGPVTALFLNWEPQRHRRVELAEALRQGPFGDGAKVEVSGSGLNLLVHAVRES
jgi:SAM-dependent methyltransferase